MCCQGIRIKCTISVQGYCTCMPRIDSQQRFLMIIECGLLSWLMAVLPTITVILPKHVIVATTQIHIRTIIWFKRSSIDEMPSPFGSHNLAWGTYRRQQQNLVLQNALQTEHISYNKVKKAPTQISVLVPLLSTRWIFWYIPRCRTGSRYLYTFKSFSGS